MAEPDPWTDRAFLRGNQYKTDTNLAARQAIYAYQHPRIDLAARVLDLAAPAPSETIVDVGCGNGMYLAELSRRGGLGHVLGIDRGADPKTMGERVGLDDGESLARSFFPQVTRHDFVAELRVPTPGTIEDYVRSGSGTSRAADPQHVAESVAATFPRSPDGHYIITSHSGCLICQVS